MKSEIRAPPAKVKGDLGIHATSIVKDEGGHVFDSI